MPIEYCHTLDTMGLEKPALSDPLWRYMDFSKFVATLVNRGLYRSRMDRLGDAYEGWVPKTPREQYHGFLQNEFFRRDRELRKKATELRKRIYASCWHANDDESDAMWKLYMKSKNGIAIRTTCRSFHKALKQTPESCSLYKVDYADQTKQPNHGESMIRACLTKRKPFFARKRSAPDMVV